MGYTITVLGLGFVGLTTALAFAEKGNKVYGYDINQEKMNTLKSGKLPFVEPKLDDILLKHINKNFILANNIEQCIIESEFIFLCVGTPSKQNGEVDLTYIYSALNLIPNNLNDDKYKVIVVKSTVPPSTTSEKIIPYIRGKRLLISETYLVANNPEFLREGHCWEDMINADRIVCGVENKKAEELLLSLYDNFNVPFFSVSLNTGEFIKYLSNTLLATMISYSNEMAKLAYTIGDIQIKEAFQILHKDKRWKNGTMSSYVYPGCGYGGYCLPKDTKALYRLALEKGYHPTILQNVINVNESMPEFMANMVDKVATKQSKIGILGLSFKPGSDDVRDTSSAKIIKILFDKGYEHIFVYDPLAMGEFKKYYHFSKIDYCTSVDEICSKSEILVLVTAWDEFKKIRYKNKDKIIIDCRYFLE